MRFFFRFAALALAGLGLAGACSTTEFTTAGNGNSAGLSATGGSGGDTTQNGGEPGSGGTAGGSAGTVGGGTRLCSGAKDCDDGNPCTVDTCGADGVCVNAAKCTGDQPVCCDGQCGQCCSKSDCNDNVDCTDDECFAGVCTFTPGACADDADYCSPTDGCVPRGDCNTDVDCDDNNPCTTDTCVNHLCSYATCPNGGSCCPGLGCGECCSDSQCPHDDPCNPNHCGADLKCAGAPRCPSGETCCPSADGTTALCGSCCEASDCPDDGIPCTVEKCKANPDGVLGCSSVPDASRCQAGQTCDPRRGCFAPQCKEAKDCNAPLACTQVACVDGTCVYGNVKCSDGQQCCSTSGKCEGCCSNDDCASNTNATLCCPDTGQCAACCTDSDCQGHTYYGGGGSGVSGGGTTGCMHAFCDSGTCKTESVKCGLEQRCCDGAGCILLTQSCGSWSN